MAAAPVAGKRDVGSEGLVVERKAESGDGTPDFVDDGIEALGGGETRVENALSIERTDASDRDVARRNAQSGRRAAESLRASIVEISPTKASVR